MIKIHPLLRASLILGGISVLCTSITWAAFNSQVTIAASTMSSTTASLKIQTSSASWSSSASGFRIKDMVPGQGSTQRVYFKNAGGVKLKLSVHVPRKPAKPPRGYGFSGWENVLIDIKGDSCGDTVRTNLEALLSRDIYLPCAPLPIGSAGDKRSPGHVGNYTIRFDVNQDAITGDHVGVGRFDLQFTGSQAL